MLQCLAAGECYPRLRDQRRKEKRREERKKEQERNREIERVRGTEIV